MAMLGILRRWAPFALAATALAALSPPSFAHEPGAADYRFSGPYTHGNLTIYMIHAKAGLSGKTPITLQEAMQKDVVRVHETGSVNELQVENLGDDLVFIQSGDIVKGGKQDRVLSVDLLLPPRSGRVAIASFCVEQSRWTGRGKEDVTKFSSSGTMLPSRDMKIAARAPLMTKPEPPAVETGGRRVPQQAGSVGNSQDKVWRGVSETQEKLNRNVGAPVAAPQSASSLQLAMENEKLKQATDAYTTALASAIDKEPGAIGFVFAINGQVNSADVYGSPELFRKMWPKLLRAAAVDAFAEQQQGRRYELVETDEVQAFLAEGNKGKGTDTEVNRRIRVTTRRGETVLCIETRDQDHQGAVVHRSYIAP